MKKNYKTINQSLSIDESEKKSLKKTIHSNALRDLIEAVTQYQKILTKVFQ